MYRKYYSYNDMPVVSKPKVQENNEEKQLVTKPCDSKISKPVSGIFGNLEKDDLILLIVIFVLLADNCDDSLLLIALAFIFFNS